MVIVLLMLAAPPLLLPQPQPVESEARRVIERQRQAPPRTEAELSAEEAVLIRRQYLQSIGQRIERARDEPR
jgi:hypothetical protein